MALSGRALDSAMAPEFDINDVVVLRAIVLRVMPVIEQAATIQERRVNLLVGASHIKEGWWQVKMRPGSTGGFSMRYTGTSDNKRNVGICEIGQCLASNNAVLTEMITIIRGENDCFESVVREMAIEADSVIKMRMVLL